jgi:hypothetical protein
VSPNRSAGVAESITSLNAGSERIGDVPGSVLLSRAGADVPGQLCQPCPRTGPFGSALPDLALQDQAGAGSSRRLACGRAP